MFPFEQNKFFRGDITEQELRAFQSSPNKIKQMWPQHSFDTDIMAKFIHPDNEVKRKKLRELLSTDLFEPEYNVPIERERDLAYDRLKAICENGHLSVNDFDENPDWVFTAHDMVAPIDPSTATKMTVQFNLFGGTLLSIGTEKHHKLIQDIDNFKKVGCFGLSEVGYGNNAVKMETKAVYNPADETFTINTPTPLAQKYWITNGALHAHYCLVFADLRLRDDSTETGEGETEGVHAFLVPIRDLETHEPLPGVVIEDMGHKMGLNGIDNAKLSFNNVKIPRENMLDKFAQIDSNGEYQTEVEGKARNRFLKTADQLLSGRLCIASMSQGSCKGLLAMATEYSCSRLSTGPTGESTVPIMAFNLQQRSLIPLIAKTIAIETALVEAKKNWRLHRQNTPKTTKHSLIAQCCGVKAYSGWHVSKLANETRERCGGQGFLSANRFGLAITGTHSSITAEGDCSVLMMKTAMELGKDISKNPQMVKNNMGGFMLAKVTSMPIVGNLLKNGLAQTFGLTMSINGKKTEPKHVKALAMLIAHRAGYSLTNLGLAMKMTEDDKKFLKGINDKATEQEYKRRIQYHSGITTTQQTMQKASNDWIESFCVARFVKAIVALEQSKEEGSDKVAEVLWQLCELYILGMIKEDSFFFKDIVNFNSAQLDKKMDIIVDNLAPEVLGICDSFGFTKEMMKAPIAQDWVKYNSVDNAGEVKGIDF